MTCVDCREWIIDLAEGVESPAMRAVRDHVQTCAACAEDLAIARRIGVALRHQPVRDPGPSFDARVLARWSTEHAVAPAGAAHWIRRVAIGYAAVWSTIGAGLLVWIVAAGGFARVVSALVNLLGPAVSVTRTAVEFLASLVLAANIVSAVAGVLQPACLALARALYTPQALGGLLVLGTCIALVIQSNAHRVNRRRTHHVHAFV